MTAFESCGARSSVRHRTPELRRRPGCTDVVKDVVVGQLVDHAAVTEPALELRRGERMAHAEEDVDQVKHPEQLFVAADGVHGGSGGLCT